jgi:hypothetical protein
VRALNPGAVDRRDLLGRPPHSSDRNEDRVR